MKKKLVSALLCATMAASLLAGCGSGDTSDTGILGGQNPLPMYIAGVKTLDLSNLSAYDQGCNEEFQKAMKDYFEGNCDKDTAIETFKKAVVEKYPDLSE